MKQKGLLLPAAAARALSLATAFAPASLCAAQLTLLDDYRNIGAASLLCEDQEFVRWPEFPFAPFKASVESEQFCPSGEHVYLRATQDSIITPGGMSGAGRADIAYSSTMGSGLDVALPGSWFAAVFSVEARAEWELSGALEIRLFDLWAEGHGRVYISSIPGGVIPGSEFFQDASGRTEFISRITLEPGTYLIEANATLLRTGAPGSIEFGEHAEFQFSLSPAAGCRPDCNRDGRLTVNDFICFQGEWRRRTTYGDYMSDGRWTINDFIAFQAAWRAGCP